MEIDSSKLTELKIQLQSLASFCSSKFMNNFPIEIVDTRINNTDFEISSWYSTDLNLSNSMRFVVDTFYKLDGISSNISNESSTRCLDAILVLIQYVNLVICSRFGLGLWLENKKSLEEMQSSSRFSNSSSSGEL